jgi:multimeric flavodoxin WrbA
LKVMIITCSPNKDGLTETCGGFARRGVEDARGEAQMVRLNDLDIAKCKACDNGWGTCQKEHRCQVEDDFQKLHESVGAMDAFIVITPVYWGDLSESAKAFFDRLRRCEAINQGKNKMEGKPVISVAAAGGTGRGTLTCLSSMERLWTHMRADISDLLGITRRNRDYMLDAIRSAARQMTAG